MLAGAGDIDQDLSMRITQVSRRTASGWETAHRHADPLVRPISPQRAG
jgi:ketosteroid isomerase-like protein